MEQLEHPFSVVLIAGEQAEDMLRSGFYEEPQEYRTVKEADQADHALADPGSLHLCPICKEQFFTKAFKVHAPLCIKQHNAGRVHSFAASGSHPATNNYQYKVKITPGVRTP